jgi:outer membrane protein TolC
MYIIRNFIIVILSGLTLGSAGQEETLDNYIDMGLENNLALKQKEVNFQKSMEVLKQARALFFPDISLNARYTAAEGGRIIEFPVGTMLNPVYQSLNFLLGQDLFPDIENMEFAFYRPTEHETKVRLAQPIIDTKIIYNQRINKELSNAIRADAGVYKRQLVAEIKTAYFNYQKTVSLLQLVDDTRELLVENIRVNESLFQNDVVTIDNVFRSRAELSKLERQEAEARKNHEVARAYFNFLLNRPFETAILADILYDSITQELMLDDLAEHAVVNREELEMLRSYSRVADNNLGMNQMNKLPNLYAVVDYGFQGRYYEFNMRQDYLFASLIFRWDLFHGFQNKAKIGEARIEQHLRNTQLEEAEKQIRLETVGAHYDLIASAESVKASAEELLSARNAFKVVNRKYGEGQASLIEYIDARSTMTQAEMLLIISKYDFHIKYAELERVACLYPFENE